MAFTSLIFFFVFFPCSLLIYYFFSAAETRVSILEKYRIKDIFLILASIGFYGWACLNNIVFLVIYIIYIYVAGKMIQNCKRKRSFITFFIMGTIGVLYLYKYFNFSVNVLNRIFQMNIENISIMAPLGISFITFSAISYLVDIYREDAEAGNFIDVVLYLTFFPKVISGPIQLWKDFEGQIKRKVPNVDQMIIYINRIVIGMSKKVILADNFGLVISRVQSNVGAGIDIPTAWGTALLYMLQIYYDFSGYSDMAIGLAGLFGIEIKENFNFPYISKSITEFWRRWHISLGTWFREYIYIPLGGNRKGIIRTLINLFIVFLVTGIWHGAGWNYILWGVLNGICMVVERIIKDKKWYLSISKYLKWTVTISIVFFSWQIFRLPYLSDIKRYFGIMFGMIRFEQVDFGYKYYFEFKIIILILIGIVGAIVLAWEKLRRLTIKINSSVTLFVIQELIVLICAIISIMCMVNSTYSPFIYFQY